MASAAAEGGEGNGEGKGEEEEAEESITGRVLAIGKAVLAVPSKEGEYAALVLARLFARSDGVGEVDGFLAWVDGYLGTGEEDAERGDGDDAVFVRFPFFLGAPRAPDFVG